MYQRMPIDDMLNRIPTNLLIAAITAYSFAESSVTAVLDFFNRLVMAYNALFRAKYFIFFEESAHP